MGVKRIMVYWMWVLMLSGMGALSGAEEKAGGDVNRFEVKILPISTVSGAQEKVDGEADYVIGPGDMLDISNWKDESLTKSVLVLPDGKISFPLIGMFRAAGKTVPELKQEIEEAMIKYVPDPVVTVEVRQVNSMLIYVIGRVNTPGKFILNTNVTVLQALAMAGGLNPFAKKDKIRIIRQSGNRHSVLPFLYDSVVEDANLEQNIRLKRGDVVVVP
jgi:polysaccharide biosynthesis/export protein